MLMLEKYKMVVFDDDPTGIQTVHGCLLLTEWSEETLHAAFRDSQPFFYILTNSRALTAEEARERVRSAVEAVVSVNRDYGFRLICVSRSDSCLRGHFPLETDVMREVLERHGIEVWRPVPFVPAFIESGRVTIDGTHYMRDGGQLIPVSETEFARDNVFGYHHSRLSEYIAEKGGKADDYEIVNAQSYDELYAYREAFFTRIASWHGAVVIRSSSSLPRAFSGIADKALLTRSDLGIEGQGAGCFIVGSHVQKTTRQLNALLTAEGVRGIELPINRIVDDGDTLAKETLETMLRFAEEGVTPVVYTARQEVRIADAAKRQHLGQTVSDFLVRLVREMPYVPQYLVAKGGITSHDILTHGLHVRMARVMGQAINSVPCVMAEKDGKRLPYIIFPGNVGNDMSLKEIYLGLGGIG